MSDSGSTGSGEPLRDAAVRDAATAARDGMSAYAANLRPLAPGTPQEPSHAMLHLVAVLPLRCRCLVVLSRVWRLVLWFQGSRSAIAWQSPGI